MEHLTFAATAGVEGNTLSGVAHTFGTRTLRGSRYIEFAQGAFRFSDVRAFMNHDTTLLLGRQSNGTVRLEQGDGLRYSIDLPDTSYAADLKALIARGDLTEMSFGIMPGEFTTSKADDGRSVITYQSADLFDISPVSLPAFGGTSVELHSGENQDPTPEAEGVAPGPPSDQHRSQGANMRTATEILAAMEAAVGDSETFAALDAELSAVTNSARLAELRTPVMPAVIRATPRGDAGEDFAFEQYLRTGIRNADLTFAQTVGTTTEGGFAVPQGFLARITERLVAFGGIRSVSETITTANGIPLEWPSNDDASFTKADTPAEGIASAAGADLVFGTVTLGAHRYSATGTGNVPLLVSQELLDDAQFDIAGFVARKLGERIARRQAYDLARGSGSGEPLGIFYASAQDVSMPGGSVPTYAKLLDMVHTIDPAYRQNAVWLFNDVTAKVIENILDAVSGKPLLVGTQYGIEGAVRVGYGGNLLGYPVVIDSAIPDLSNLVLGMAFGDFREGYIIRDVANVSVLVNPYTSMNTNQVAYNAWARMDGTIQNRYAYATAEGTT